MKALLAIATTGCLAAMPEPPTRGYGAPYRGTGKTIFVKDSRSDWDISEGDKKITAEYALEASGDPEYEARRQIWKDHNAKLYEEAKRHRRSGYMMVGGAIGAFLGGLIVSYAIAPSLANEDVTVATPDMPESRHTTAGSASMGTALLGTALMIAGVAGSAYGYYGARKAPDYLSWRVPAALNRPAYIRRFTEEYNAKLEGSDSSNDAPPSTKPTGKRPQGPLRPPPGVRPQPTKTALPRPRGGRV